MGILVLFHGQKLWLRGDFKTTLTFSRVATMMPFRDVDDDHFC